MPLASQGTEYEPTPQNPSEEWKDELKRRIEAHRRQGDQPVSDSPSRAPAKEASSHSRNSDSLPPPSGLDRNLEQPSVEPLQETSIKGIGSRPLIDTENSARMEDESSPSADWSNESDSIERLLYPGNVSKPSRQQIITFSEKAEPSSPPIEENFRKPTAASAYLDPVAPDLPEPQETAAYSEDSLEEDGGLEEEEWLSREIFLSRFLAGLVDLLLSAFAGLVFSWTASWLLGYDFFSTATIQIGAAVGLVFYWVSSIFFLTLSSQTPGMHLTGLQLLYQESSELPFLAVLLRTIVILPVILTLAGLLWGLFDPWGRCLHDRLSQTRVAPIPELPAAPATDLFG